MIIAILKTLHFNNLFYNFTLKRHCNLIITMPFNIYFDYPFNSNSSIGRPGGTIG